MATMPVICDDPSCGTIWGASNLIAGDAGSVTLAGNKVKPCPKCGGWGSIPDGEYGLINDTLEVVSSADLPGGTLQTIIDLLEARAAGTATDEDVIERVEFEAPELADTVRDYLSKPNTVSWLAILIAILIRLSQPATPTAPEIAEEIWARKPPAAKQMQTFPAPVPESLAAPGGSKRKRPPKQHGKAKHRKSRKRR